MSSGEGSIGVRFRNRSLKKRGEKGRLEGPGRVLLLDVQLQLLLLSAVLFQTTTSSLFKATPIPLLPLVLHPLPYSIIADSLAMKVEKMSSLDGGEGGGKETKKRKKPKVVLAEGELKKKQNPCE